MKLANSFRSAGLRISAASYVAFEEKSSIHGVSRGPKAIVDGEIGAQNRRGTIARSIWPGYENLHEVESIGTSPPRHLTQRRSRILIKRYNGLISGWNPKTGIDYPANLRPATLPRPCLPPNHPSRGSHLRCSGCFFESVSTSFPPRKSHECSRPTRQRARGS